ncbi:MAG: hypothetical protein M3Q34_01685 [bacterium]|nr:hypothetical protein [bacterium]
MSHGNEEKKHSKNVLESMGGQLGFIALWPILLLTLLWAKLGTSVFDGTVGQWVFGLSLLGILILGVWFVDTFLLVRLPVYTGALLQNRYTFLGPQVLEVYNGYFKPPHYVLSEKIVDFTKVITVTSEKIKFPGGEIDKTKNTNKKPGEYETADGSIVLGDYLGIFRAREGALDVYVLRDPENTARTGDTIIESAIGKWCKENTTEHIFQNYVQISGILGNLFLGRDLSQFEIDNGCNADDPKCYQFALSHLSQKASEDLFVAKKAAEGVQQLVNTGQLSPDLGMDAFLLLTGKQVTKTARSYEFKQLQQLLNFVGPFLAPYLQTHLGGGGQNPNP